MHVKSFEECSKGIILQYFQPSLSYHLLLRSLFCLFKIGHFTQVLLYMYKQIKGTAYIVKYNILLLLYIIIYFHVYLPVDESNNCSDYEDLGDSEALLEYTFSLFETFCC